MQRFAKIHKCFDRFIISLFLNLMSKIFKQNYCFSIGNETILGYIYQKHICKIELESLAVIIFTGLREHQSKFESIF